MAWDRSNDKKKKGSSLPDVSSWQKSALGIVAGIALGVGACYGGWLILQDYQQRIDSAVAPNPTRLVMVAARTLNPGVRVAESDVFAVALPVESVTPDMVLYPEGIVGRYPKERILSNEFVRAERIANPERGEGLNAILPRDMRALSVEISNGEALSGHLQPGSYVDVLATYFPDDDKEDEVTRTILQGLFVLAVNERTVFLTPQEEREIRRIPRPSVTFLVTPEEAEKVTFAEQTAVLRLALRNDLDTQYADVHGVDMSSLLDRLGLAARDDDGLVATHVPAVETLRVIEGSKVEHTTVRPDPSPEPGTTP